MSFAKMKAQEVTATAAKWFTFTGVRPLVGDKPIRVLALHAGEVNRTYLNDAVRRANETIQQSTNRLTPAQIAAIRDADADIFARCVVTAWEAVYEDDLSPSPCTPDKIAEFLAALPYYEFDRFRVWAKDPHNFTDAVPNVEDLGKK